MAKICNNRILVTAFGFAQSADGSNEIDCEALNLVLR